MSRKEIDVTLDINPDDVKNYHPDMCKFTVETLDYEYKFHIGAYAFNGQFGYDAEYFRRDFPSDLNFYQFMGDINNSMENKTITLSTDHEYAMVLNYVVNGRESAVNLHYVFGDNVEAALEEYVERKTLIEENQKLVEENKTLVEENQKLIAENKKLVEENNKPLVAETN
jgi:hypothetical protein